MSATVYCVYHLIYLFPFRASTHLLHVAHNGYTNIAISVVSIQVYVIASPERQLLHYGYDIFDVVYCLPYMYIVCMCTFAC